MHKLSAVFGKEMITLARRKRFYALRALVIGAPLAAIWLTAQMQVETSGSPIRDLSAVGHSLFAAYTVVEWLFVLLMVPLLVSSVVVSERENDTLALLMATNLTSESIVRDKALARVFFTLLLLLSGIPFLVVLTAFGGVDLKQVVAFCILITATVFLCSAMGLIASTRAASTQRALLGTYLLLFRYVGIVLLLSVVSIPVWFGLPFMARMLGFHGGDFSDLAGLLIPFAMLPLGAMSTDVPSVLLVVSCVGFPLCVMSRFRYAVRHCVEKLPLVEDRTGLWYQLEMGELDAFFKRLNRTGVASSWTLPNRPPGSPSRYRPDLREPLVGRGALTAVITLGLIMGLGCFMAGVSRDFAHGVAQVQLVLISACVILLAGTAFADDKERNTLEILLSTSISRRALVMGRFLRVVKRVTVYALAPQVLLLLGLPSALTAGGSDDIWYSVWPLGLLGLVLFLGTAIVIGLVFSGLCRSRESALGSTFLALAVWYLGPYGLYALMHAFGGSEPAIDTLLFLSPLGWFQAVFEMHHPPWGYLLGILGGVGLAGSALMAWLIRRFDAIMVKA